VDAAGDIGVGGGAELILDDLIVVGGHAYFLQQVSPQ
jgi:hypothetical protein